MTAVNFVDELANAAVDAIATAEDLFIPAIGEHATQGLKVEYARQGNQAFIRGLNGTCAVYVGEVEPTGQTFRTSRLSAFNMTLTFDLIEVKGVAKRKSLIEQAVVSVFGDNGTAFFAELGDAGGNRLGGSGTVEIVGMVEVPSRGPSNVLLEVELRIFCWHRIPLIAEV